MLSKYMYILASVADASCRARTRPDPDSAVPTDAAAVFLTVDKASSEPNDQQARGVMLHDDTGIQLW